MRTKALRAFQSTTIDAAVAALHIANDKYAQAKGTAAGASNEIARHHSTLLIEAPTGSGKTLMAAAAVERFSQDTDVVWFWFAPFKGVIAQTISFLKDECSTLRLRDLSTDRSISGCKRGDVFVTTWQTVAVKDTSQRTVRRERETAPSLDAFIAGLRDKGLRIGIVVDEAHHSFSAGTQAALLCRDVIQPDFTVLITATPDDKDIEKWQKSHDIKAISRLAVSRDDAVQAGLIKHEVNAVSYTAADEKQASLIDFEGAALKGATLMHRQIKAELTAAKIQLVPLMLVQVDSKSKDSVADAKARLLKLGFAESAIAIHTSDEPDPNLAAIANNETIEVLIFKMAIALGFDAPRAWTLVSMRSAKGEDFGVQLIGRILRVHRRLHGKQVSGVLSNGYVFLADPEAQTGLKAAGERVNSFRTQCQLVAPTTTMIVRLGSGQAEVQQIGPSGQTVLFQPEALDAKTFQAAPQIEEREPDVSGHPQAAFNLEGGSAPPVTITPQNATNDNAAAITVQALTRNANGKVAAIAATAKRYQLRVSAPKQFKTSHLPEVTEGLEASCAAHFFVDGGELLRAIAAKVQVNQRTVEVFTQQVQLELFKADFDPIETARRAQEILMKNEGFHAKELKHHLLRRLQVIAEQFDIADCDNQTILAKLLNTLLVRDQGVLLRSAQKKALAEYALCEAAEELPSEYVSEIACDRSQRNVYGIFPNELNSWEREFAVMLDQAPADAVQWWHRNEVRKPWSVSLVGADGKNFYPDFVIGVAARKAQEGVLLADPKERYDAVIQAPKVLAQHPAYGRALILFRAAQANWYCVVWNEKQAKAELGPGFEWDRAKTW